MARRRKGNRVDSSRVSDKPECAHLIDVRRLVMAYVPNLGLEVPDHESAIERGARDLFHVGVERKAVE